MASSDETIWEGLKGEVAEVVSENDRYNRFVVNFEMWNEITLGEENSKGKTQRQEKLKILV